VKVVVVEDESSMLDMIATALRGRHYEVATFTEPFKALEWMTSVHWDVDLVITDIMMPGTNGLDLAKTIREKAGPIAILLVSARLSDEALWGDGQQQLPFLAKPFGLPELFEAVEGAIARCPRQRPDPS
jgi:two-component system cell cycle sensor histidine kinase/response regulator CckA